MPTKIRGDEQYPISGINSRWVPEAKATPQDSQVTIYDFMALRNEKQFLVSA
jgi:hypothetical protein